MSSQRPEVGRMPIIYGSANEPWRQSVRRIPVASAPHRGRRTFYHQVDVSVNEALGALGKRFVSLKG